MAISQIAKHRISDGTPHPTLQIPANKRHGFDVGLMLGQHSRRW